MRHIVLMTCSKSLITVGLFKVETHWNVNKYGRKLCSMSPELSKAVENWINLTFKSCYLIEDQFNHPGNTCIMSVFCFGLSARRFQIWHLQKRYTVTVAYLVFFSINGKEVIMVKRTIINILSVCASSQTWSIQTTMVNYFGQFVELYNFSV